MTDRPVLGIGLMVATTLVFAIQDGFSRHLAGEYNTMMVVMIRYWFFAAFVIVWAARTSGGLTHVMRSRRPLLQIARGCLLAAEILVAVQGFVWVGLVDSHAIFAIYPLIVVALSTMFLGEKIGWRRWLAVTLGFLGVLLILAPAATAKGPAHLIPVLSAAMFAAYQVLTRLAARSDSSQTSFFYTGVAGCVVATVVGFPFLEPMRPADQGWMAALCLSGALGHYLLIRALEVTEASTLQPFTYLQLVFATSIGVMIFGETLALTTVAGAVIVIATGLFALFRERQQRT